MNSLDAWLKATTEHKPKTFSPVPYSAGKMFCLCFVALILFAVVAFWPILAQFDAAKHFTSAAIVAGIPGGLILLACRASHSKEGRSALWGVVILVAVLFCFASLF